MLVIGGSASGMLSKSLAGTLGCKIAGAEIKRFPDRECYVKIKDNLKGEDVVVVQTSYPDECLVEMLLIQDAVSRTGPASLTAVVPYMGYARQDKMFTEGEAVSARAVAKHIGSGADRVLTVDIHNVSVMDAFGKRAENVTAMREIGRFLQAEGADAILSPDKGSVDRARIAAETAGCRWDFLEKRRIDGQTVEMKPKSLDADGKVVAIVDDIIATGGTIIKAAEQLKAQGAKKIIAACTHGLYTGGAVTKLQGACDLLVSTDTLESPTSKISAAMALSEALGRGG